MRTVTFSFENPNEPYADVSWLVHWLYYPIYELGRYRALEWSVALCGMVTALILLAAIKANGGSKLAFGLYFGVLFTAFRARMRLRPEMFSLIIFAYLVLLLIQYMHGKLKGKLELSQFSILFLIWGQVHPAWSYGLFLIFSWWAGCLLAGTKEERGRLVKDTPFLLIGPLALVWLSPYGIETALFPFQMLLGFTTSGTAQINEWQAPHWNLTTLPFLASVLAVLLAYIFMAIRNHKVYMELFWVGGQALLLTLWVRYSSFAFIAIAPQAVALADALLIKAPRLRSLLAVAVLLLMAALTWTGMLYTRTEVDQNINYPVKETAFLKEQLLSGNALHTFVAGGYLDFQYFPLGKTFFDGRSPSFVKQLNEYSMAQTSLGAFHSFLHEYPFEVAILPYSNMLVVDTGRGAPRNVMALMLPPKTWAPVYYGPYGAVFLKRLPKYEAAISEFGYLCLYPDDLIFLTWAIQHGQVNEREALKEMRRAVSSGAPINIWTGRVATARLEIQR